MLNSYYSKTDALIQIENLIDYAWKQALKYRFDPVIGKIHSDYLEMVKETKNQIKEQDERSIFKKTNFNGKCYLPEIII